MAHNATHRRILASPDHNPKTSISMDPTLKKQPKPTPFTSNISNQFSQLYANHKVHKSNSKDPSGYSADTHLKVKSWIGSSVLDSSCTALTKSKSQHGSSTMVKVKKSVQDVEKSIVVQKKEAVIKKVPHKVKEFHKEVDVKGALVNLSKSQEIERCKGFEEEGDEIVKKQSLSLPLKNCGRRKSFCSSKIELSDFFSCTGVKVVSVDMPPFMQIHAVNCARKTHDSLEKFTSKALAFTLKKEFDGVYGPAWHCIVGTSFGSFVTHSVGGFMYFSMDHKLYVLLFKTTVQKAESS
ncbi:hypothetical protein HAX54_039554 [Datura stramonium]|uniref:Dynein light chain n=1 Tax=Datura stramonium TaxID=4076 RepID=A0ABS8RNK6_DATST|nr:hypothetical protein [Datura stramonium]